MILTLRINIIPSPAKLPNYKWVWVVDEFWGSVKDDWEVEYDVEIEADSPEDLWSEEE